ncbi:MAG: PAS domain S-box protein [Crocinitomicaceae bacterium]|nr:PAS domain S-box protein [Crocinitomicaceae bacterium]
MNDEANIWKERYLKENLARRDLEEKLKRKTTDLKERTLRLFDLEKLNEQTQDHHTQQKEDYFKMLYDNNPLALLIYNPSTYRILDVNQTAIEKYGYSRSEFVKLKIHDLHPKNQWNSLEKDVENIINDSEFEASREWDHITKDGENIIVDIQACTIPYGTRRVRLVQITDVSEKVKLQEYVVRSDEKYQKIIENIELGLLEVDLDDRITKVYPKFSEMTGYGANELIGLVASEVLIFGDSEVDFEHEIAKRREGKSSVYEVKIIKKNGDYAWVLVSGTPVFNEDNEIIGSIGIHVDITDRKNMEQDLIDAKLTAEQNAAIKEEFLARMSHEMRTPLNGIVGLNYLLRDTSLDETQLKYIDSIKKSSDHLLNIINDILDFSKLEAGKLEVDSIPFNIETILDQTKSALLYSAESKGVYFDIKVDGNMAECYLGDPFRLYQVILNLCTNAIKFTEDGGLLVEISVAKESKASQLIVIDFTDTGIGIAENKIVDLFKSFSQTDIGTARKYGGTGLGLSIARQLAEAMGGSLELLKSKIDAGSTFRLSMNLPVYIEVEREKKAIVELDFDFEEGIKILLVDDNEMNRMMARAILERKKFLVDEAVDGKEAIVQLKDNEYAVVLMDIMMPEMDGLEATSVIRNELKLEVPIIALTANAIKGDGQKCLDAGMQGYLSKPYSPNQLYEVISANICK